jgi:hypothetical protein
VFGTGVHVRLRMVGLFSSADMMTITMVMVMLIVMVIVMVILVMNVVAAGSPKFLSRVAITRWPVFNSQPNHPQLC